MQVGAIVVGLGALAALGLPGRVPSEADRALDDGARDDTTVGSMEAPLALG
jgi:hypothetical protein